MPTSLAWDAMDSKASGSSTWSRPTALLLRSSCETPTQLVWYQVIIVQLIVNNSKYCIYIYNYSYIYIVIWLVVEKTILKHDGVRQWEGWHPIYEMENNPNVPNHQPALEVVGEAKYLPQKRTSRYEHLRFLAGFPTAVGQKFLQPGLGVSVSTLGCLRIADTPIHGYLLMGNFTF